MSHVFDQDRGVVIHLTSQAGTAEQVNYRLDCHHALVQNERRHHCPVALRSLDILVTRAVRGLKVRLSTTDDSELGRLRARARALVGPHALSLL